MILLYVCAVRLMNYHNALLKISASFLNKGVFQKMFP